MTTSRLLAPIASAANSGFNRPNTASGIAIAGIGTGVLLAVSLVAYSRRQSRQFLLISVAVGALLGRSIIGARTVLGYIAMSIHHCLEHSPDFIIAAVVRYAVYAHAPGTLSTGR